MFFVFKHVTYNQRMHAKPKTYCIIDRLLGTYTFYYFVICIYIGTVQGKF